MSHEDVVILVHGQRWRYRSLVRWVLFGAASIASVACIGWYASGCRGADLALAIFSVASSTALTVGLVDLLMSKADEVARSEQRKVLAVVVTELASKAVADWTTASALAGLTLASYRTEDIFAESTFRGIADSLQIDLMPESNELHGLGGDFLAELQDSARRAERVLTLHSPLVGGTLRRLLVGIADLSDLPFSIKLKRTAVQRGGGPATLRLGEVGIDPTIARQWSELVGWLQAELLDLGWHGPLLFDGPKDLEHRRARAEAVRLSTADLRSARAVSNIDIGPPV